ncbi:MAG: hypothetical protein ACFFAO_20655, partial [Candidatus Hermodarchaeota archaeon]
MDKNRYYKYMFLSGAIWNFFIAAIFFIGSILMLSSLSVHFDMTIPPSLVFIHAFLGMVLIVGIGLFVVSKDLAKNHNIVIMFIIEKFLMFIIFMAYYLTGAYNFLLASPSVIDLIYGIL